jgi:predicted Rossmann fold nucleotide-binding protein DprA/Smf involved in DNA uptake
MIRISANDPHYPAGLRHRLGNAAPQALTLVGNGDLLKRPKLALLCSSRCPGNVIIKTYDLVQRWRDEGRIIISGFHSPVEKECLGILLRGSQPIIICPARSLEGMRIPPEWRPQIDSGRLLLLSGFAPSVRRTTSETARRRNEFVAALADEIHLAYASPGGHLERLRLRSDLHEA